MNFKYSVAIMVLFSGYACAADVSGRVKGIGIAKKETPSSHVVLGSGHHYPGKPDSEEKMFIAAIMRQSVTRMKQRLHEFRADSPYPEVIEEITAFESTDVADVQIKEPLKPLCLSARDRKDSGVSSVSSYGSMSTITLDVATGIETPVSTDTPPVLQSEIGLH